MKIDMTDIEKRNNKEIPTLIFDTNLNVTYKRNAFLGKGSFAKCFEITNTTNGYLYACKIVSKKHLQVWQMKEKMVQEISIHRTLTHKHIVEFHGFFEDTSYIYIVLELCSRKSMAELQRRRKYLTVPEVRYYMQQVLSAVQYLHEKEIIHRDLKLGNLFINGEMEVKVGDLGLATHIEKGERKKTTCGTPNYIAPEILEKKGHGPEVDIWSIGCIIFTLLVGKLPFETTSIKETYSRIRHCAYRIPMTMNKSAAKMLRNIFVKDPDKRPKVTELIDNDFFRKGYTPPSLPTSCLVMAPKFQNVEQNFEIERKPLTELINHNTENKKTKVTNTTLISQQQTAKMKENISLISKSYNYLTILKRQLIKVLKLKPSEKDAVLSDEALDPTVQPFIWISSWVDYSNKYGFAYKLCDNSIGVLFIDCTKLVLLSNGINIQYSYGCGCEKYFTINNYDTTLKKKMHLLNQFQQYMGNLIMAGASMPVRESDSFVRLPVLTAWTRNKRAVVMLLSNGTLQINFFPDHSKIILCPLMEAVTFINKKRDFQTYRLQLMEQYGCSKELSWRLQYAVRRINEMLKH